MAKSQVEREAGVGVLLGAGTGAGIGAGAGTGAEAGAGAGTAAEAAAVAQAAAVAAAAAQAEAEAQAEAGAGGEPQAQAGAQILSLLFPQAHFPFLEHWHSLSWEKEIYILYLAQLQIPSLAPVLC